MANGRTSGACAVPGWTPPLGCGRPVRDGGLGAHDRDRSLALSSSRDRDRERDRDRARDRYGAGGGGGMGKNEADIWDMPDSAVPASGEAVFVDSN